MPNIDDDNLPPKSQRPQNGKGLPTRPMPNRPQTPSTPSNNSEPASSQLPFKPVPVQRKRPQPQQVTPQSQTNFENETPAKQYIQPQQEEQDYSGEEVRTSQPVPISNNSNTNYPPPQAQNRNTGEETVNPTFLMLSIVAAFIIPIVGLIMGIVGLLKFKKPNTSQEGKGKALVATILGGVLFAIQAISLIIPLALGGLVGSVTAENYNDLNEQIASESVTTEDTTTSEPEQTTTSETEQPAGGTVDLTPAGENLKNGGPFTYELMTTSKEKAVLTFTLTDIVPATEAQKAQLQGSIAQSLDNYNVVFVKGTQKWVSGADTAYNSDYSSYSIISDGAQKASTIVSFGGFKDCNNTSFPKDMTTGVVLEQCWIGVEPKDGPKITGLQYKPVVKTMNEALYSSPVNIYK